MNPQQITIKFEKSPNGPLGYGLWRADLVELPGTPPAGFGATKCDAVANLMKVLQSELLGELGQSWAQRYLQ